MKKKIFKNFLMDHLFFTIAYFISDFLIALFYYISVGNNIELIYPGSISIFVYVIFLTYRWITYSEFNMNVKKLGNNMNYYIRTYTNEEKELVQLISNIHQNYMDKISSIHFEDENKKRFLSQWIHNMKTPISVIDLILQKNIKGEISQKKSLENINEENVSLLNKLEQVLRFIRLEEFTEDYIPEVVDLVATLRKIINKRKNQFIYSRVYPKFEIGEEHVYVISDKKWNEVMIEQIISNAIKYSNTEEKAKNVYFNINKEENKVILSIRDEGVGIPEYDISRIFNPFFTGDNGRNYANATGIGLYFSSQVAKKLGHHITVNSKMGEGTQFNVIYLSKL